MATFGAMLNVRSKLGCFCSDAVSIWKPWYHNVALNYIFIAQIIYFNWIDINQCLLHTDSHINKERLDWIRQTIFFRGNVFRLADQLQCHIGFELSSHECSAVNFDKTWHSQLEIVQAMDQIGRWVGGKVIDVDGTSYLVAFNGYQAEFKMWFSSVAVPPQIHIAIMKKGDGEAFVFFPVKHHVMFSALLGCYCDAKLDSLLYFRTDLLLSKEMN